MVGRGQTQRFSSYVFRFFFGVSMDLGNGLGHLTYSTLVHPAENWEQLWASVQTYLPKVKARVSPDQPFGVCLRLAAPTAAQTAANSEEGKKHTGVLCDTG